MTSCSTLAPTVFWLSKSFLLLLLLLLLFSWRRRRRRRNCFCCCSLLLPPPISSKHTVWQAKLLPIRAIDNFRLTFESLSLSFFTYNFVPLASLISGFDFLCLPFFVHFSSISAAVAAGYQIVGLLGRTWTDFLACSFMAEIENGKI